MLISASSIIQEFAMLTWKSIPAMNIAH